MIDVDRGGAATGVRSGGTRSRSAPPDFVALAGTVAEGEITVRFGGGWGRAGGSQFEATSLELEDFAA